MKANLFTPFLAFLWLSSISCQDNAGNNVAQGLIICYNNTAIPGVTHASERPPSSINILVEYIRRLEDANPTMSAQQLALQIVQRLRQDGISRTDRTIEDRLGVPFASNRLERHKFRVLLKNLLPNVEQSLDNGDLSNLERCSLHYMISNTIDENRRENEATECSRTARYTSRILTKRRRRDTELDSSDTENTELISPDLNVGLLSASVRNISQCPVELGVVYSQFGTFKAGNVLAGIAAGLNQQIIQPENVDNRYATTIIGEICEASLYQASQTVSLGASGGWTSTVTPRYYLLQNNNYLQATDAELRGGLDGLYMALRISTWIQAFSDIKISQILDMYYSPYEKGVLDNSFRACNRNILYTEMTSNQVMTTQLTNFMPVLNLAALAGVSLSNSSFPIYASAGVRAFEKYLPTVSSADLSCTGLQTIERVATDLRIFIDSSWSYATVQTVLSYVLNNIDVNKFGTRYTLYGGSSLTNLTNGTTNYLSDFFTKYRLPVHQNESSGFDYIRVFQTVENIGYDKLNNNSYVAGESTIVLLVTKTGLTEEQRNFVSQRRQIINQFLPDLKFFVLGTGAQTDYSTIVSNPTKDVIILQETTNEETLKSIGQQLVNNIKSVPRAVVNPSCTSRFSGATSTFTLTEYVEPQGTIYYRISPHYFFTGGDNRNLRIREQGYGTLNVCISRDNAKPDNQTGTCRQLSTSEHSIQINSYCEGESVNSCSPIYLSVSGGTSSPRCRDTLCRFPDDIKYTITMENVGCASGSIVTTASAILVLLLSATLHF